MARTGLCLCVCAALGAALCLGGLGARAGDDPDARVHGQLALQQALQEGLDHLNHGRFREAVSALERQIARIDGNRRYLAALRDAYKGYVAQLKRAGNFTEARRYEGFLAVIEPGVRKDPPAAPTPPPAPPEKRVEAPAPAPTPAPAPLPAAVSRGKFEEGTFDREPFNESGERPRGRDLVAKAEAEFEARRYASASKLFALAERAEVGSTRGCSDRWAYCRMYCVGQTLLENHGEGREAELEAEVKQAVLMAPRLTQFAGRLLEKIREGASPAVAVKHTPREGKGWALAETANFRVFHAQPQEAAEKAARLLEGTRAAMARKWLGAALPDWSPKCDVFLHPTSVGYMRAPGSPPAASPGHSTIQLDGGRVISRRIDVRCDFPHVLTATLPHETTHVVLAGQFGRHNVPRWVDEGVAVLSEPRDRINLHLNNLPAHQRDGALFDVGRLMRMPEYPEARLIGPFYAQSVSLVEFLSGKKGPATFVRFVRDGLDGGGYEAALAKHYGYRSFEELEREWRSQAFATGAVAAVADKR
jgi:hypothetical protein